MIWEVTQVEVELCRVARYIYRYVFFFGEILSAYDIRLHLYQNKVGTPTPTKKALSI